MVQTASGFVFGAGASLPYSRHKRTKRLCMSELSGGRVMTPELCRLTMTLFGVRTCTPGSRRRIPRRKLSLMKCRSIGSSPRGGSAQQCGSAVQAALQPAQENQTPVRHSQNQAHRAHEVGSLEPAPYGTDCVWICIRSRSFTTLQPAQENRTPVRPSNTNEHPHNYTATSIGGPVAHNSAVLLCRLRCISRADQVVLHPI